MPLTVSVKVEL